MIVAGHQVTTGERLRRAGELDLDPIVYKLMHPDPGEPPLSLAEADQAVALYRCFLKLCLLCPGSAIVPTRQLDQVWHTHMLDTAKYRADCDHVFGRFMDHFPYAGLRGDADRRAWRADFARHPPPLPRALRHRHRRRARRQRLPQPRRRRGLLRRLRQASNTRNAAPPGPPPGR